ncbi:hypothetical protein ACRALDRAFT_211903 [Sodiomyces alcalophilus JCM 7366]|uniref:uncharacterized protein n=1 Tax=Sodiomyces alcalophilus JCM 7366 TaxID=591952 RepID=UPI0039B4975B
MRRRGPKEDDSVSSFDSGYDTTTTKTLKTTYTTKTTKTISQGPSLRKSDPDNTSEEQRLPAHQQSDTSPDSTDPILSDAETAYRLIVQYKKEDASAS